MLVDHSALRGAELSALFVDLCDVGHDSLRALVEAQNATIASLMHNFSGNHARLDLIEQKLDLATAGLVTIANKDCRL